MKNRWPLLVARTLCCLLLVVYLSPVVSSITNALAGVFSAPSVFLETVMSDGRLLAAIDRSVTVALMTSVLSVGVLVFALFGFRELSVIQKRCVLGLLLLPLFIPEITHSFATAQVRADFGVEKGVGVVVFALFGFVLPFVGTVLLLKFSALPSSLRLASRDLALPKRVYVGRILLPLLLTSVISAFLFAFLLSFNEFTRTNYLQANQMYTPLLFGQLKSGGGGVTRVVASLLFVVGLGMLAVAAEVGRRIGYKGEVGGKG